MLEIQVTINTFDGRATQMAAIMTFDGEDPAAEPKIERKPDMGTLARLRKAINAMYDEEMAIIEANA